MLKRASSLCAVAMIFLSLSCEFLPLLPEEYIEERYSLGASGLFPANNAIIETTTPTFLWDSSNEATTQFQLGTSFDFSSEPLVDISALTEAEYTLSIPLTQSQVYFWRIRHTLEDSLTSQWHTCRFFYEDGSSVLAENFETSDGVFSTKYLWDLSENHPPFLQQEDVYEGNWAAQLGQGFERGDESYMQIEKTLSQSHLLSFYYKNDARYGDNFRFRLNSNLELEVADETVWKRFQILIPQGSHVLNWSFSKESSYSSGDKAALVDNILLTPVEEPNSEDFGILVDDNPSDTVWSYSLNPATFLQSQEVQEGPLALQMNDGGYLETSVTTTSLSFLSYWAKASGGSVLFLDINGEREDSVSGGSDWELRRIILPEGENTLRWECPRDMYNEEYLWIDDIRIDYPQPIEANNFDILLDGEAMGAAWTSSVETPPFLQQARVQNGESAVQLGVLNNGDTSSLETTVSLPHGGRISFWSYREDSGGYFRFYIDEGWELSTSTRTTNWIQYEYAIPSGEHILKWEYYGYSSYGIGPAMLDSIEINSFEPITSNSFDISLDGVDQNVVWSNSVDPFVFLQQDEVLTGDYAIQLGQVSSGDIAYLETTVTLPTGGIITFNSLVETGGGYFRFFINGIRELNTSSNSTSWFLRQYAIPDGEVTLRWEYYKYSSSSSYQGQAFLDDIQILTFQVPDSTDFDILLDGIPINVTWESPDGVVPFLQTSEVQSGDSAVQLGFFESTGTSSLETRVDLAEPSILGFWAKQTSSGGTYQFLNGDTILMTSSSSQDWTYYSFSLDVGMHDLSWQFSDTSTSYDPTAFVDGITLNSLTPLDNTLFDIQGGTGPMNVSWVSNSSPAAFLQSAVVQEGSHAVQMGQLPATGTASFETNVNLTTESLLQFYARTGADSGTLSVYTDTTELVSVSDLSDWSLYSVTLPAGSQTIQWEYVKDFDSTQAQAWVDSISIVDMSEAITFSEGFEDNDGSFSTANPWVTGGDVDPFVQGTTVNSGLWAAEFGGISHNESSYFTTTVIIEEPRTLSFNYSVSSESSFDYFRFYLNGAISESASGTVSWTPFSVPLEVGENTLRFEYSKDGSVSRDSDTAWVDDILIY